MVVAFDCPHTDCTHRTNDVEREETAIQLLQLHVAAVHTQVTAPAVPPSASKAARVQKVNRPTVSLAGTSEEWSYFSTRWADYKEATGIQGKELIIQLLECCEEELRKDLTRSAGGSLSDKTEDEVLAAIKVLAVREENTMVARVGLYEMRQDIDEPIRKFGARIKGQANVCKYILKCPGCNADVNYTENVLRDVLTRGIADSEIQLDLLGHTDQDMSLEDTFKFVEAKESGKRSANKLLQIQAVNSARSQYQKKKRSDTLGNRHLAQGNVRDKQLCSFCGEAGHGKNASIQTRKKSCTAYGKTCIACNRPNHVESVCRSKDNPIDPPDEGGAIFNELVPSSDEFQLCTITNGRPPAITLSHHRYDNLNESWCRQSSKPQPFLKVEISISREDYTTFGFQCCLPLSTTSSTTISAMADTGCQSCLSGIGILRKLGITRINLIPVSMQMHAANKNRIRILGAVILCISGTTSDGVVISTRQITYVTDESDRFFLSRDTCVQLGLISETFPTIGDVRQTSHSSAIDLSGSMTSVSQPSTTERATSLSPPFERSLYAKCNPPNCPKRELPPPRPTELPYPPTPENVYKLWLWLLRYYALSTFYDCTHQPLPKMHGPPLRLHIDPNATPVAKTKPIPVPIHLQEDVDESLDQDERMEVIQPVPVGTKVTWCTDQVICVKKNGKIRRTVDFQQLNKHAIRETHHTQSPFHQVRAIPPHTKKTVFDCWNGYHSVQLHPDDRHFTTFITHRGRYWCLTAPQGYIASGDAYTRRFDEIVSDIRNKTKLIDDSCHWSLTIKESFFQAVEWLDICGKNGITSNPSKFVFAQDTVTFGGFEVTPDSVRPTSEYIDSIRCFPTPRSLVDLRAWLGVLGHVSYAFAMSPHVLPFRNLLKGATFEWTAELDKVFELSKSVITAEIEKGVQIFEKDRPTCLATDWSKSGIGFWLSQKHCKCSSSKLFCCKDGWKVTLIGSRFTRGAESRYAPIEGEALAVVVALEKARYFVLGCRDLTVAVDHKPLLRIFDDRSLNDIPNTRLRNLKEKTLQYRFRMEYVPGKKHAIPDAMSRYPTETNDPMLLLEDDIAAVEADDIAEGLSDTPPMSCFLAAIRSDEPIDTTVDDEFCCTVMAALESIEAVPWNKVKETYNSDPTMLSLLETVEGGFPANRDALPLALQEYHPFRDYLSSIDGVVIYKERTVIPPPLRKQVLDSLHAAHHCITSMTARAESSVFWPGITADIKRIRLTCEDCNRNAPSQPSSPPAPLVTPTYPFQCICSDYFKYAGSHYLILVDRYSNWLQVEISKGGAKGLINDLRKMFATFGIPEECASDGGPEFIAPATTKFLSDWGVHHRRSSVGFPHSNARAEIGVKSAKRLIMSHTGPNGSLDTDAFQRAILQHRNTPDATTKVSPAMCLFGRPIRDFIPIHPGKYQPHSTWNETLAAREEALRERHIRLAERWSEHTRRLPPLVVGDHVRIQNLRGAHPLKWDRTGEVVEVRQFDQYVVRVDGSRRATLRNRKHLRRIEPFRKTLAHRTIDDDLIHLGTPLIAQPDPATASKQSLPIQQPASLPLHTAHPSLEPLAAEKATQDPPAAEPPRQEPLMQEPPATEPLAHPIPAGGTLPTISQSDTNTNNAPAMKKLPLALRRLLPHNKKGLKEE